MAPTAGTVGCLGVLPSCSVVASVAAVVVLSPGCFSVGLADGGKVVDGEGCLAGRLLMSDLWVAGVSSRVGSCSIIRGCFVFSWPEPSPLWWVR